MRKEEKRLKCTLRNGSAWNTERKYMRRYRGKCDIFFGIEHRLRQKEIKEQFNREAKGDGDLQRMQQESPMKEQAVRIVSTRPVESSLQSAVTWEQLLEKKKEQWHESRQRGQDHPGLGNVRGSMWVLSVFFWHSEGWTPRNEALLEAVSKRA